MSRFTPADIDELRDAVAEALAAEEPLELVGGGSKRGLGRPVQEQAVQVIDLEGPELRGADFDPEGHRRAAHALVEQLRTDVRRL